MHIYRSRPQVFWPLLMLNLLCWRLDWAYLSVKRRTSSPLSPENPEADSEQDQEFPSPLRLRDPHTRNFPQHAACRRLRSRAITQNLIMIVVRAHRSECWVMYVADVVFMVCSLFAVLLFPILVSPVSRLHRCERHVFHVLQSRLGACWCKFECSCSFFVV